MLATKTAPQPLSQASVVRLREDPSPSVRAETAAGVAAVFAGGALTERERSYAIEIIEHLAVDVERQVREALSQHLKHCPYLPTGIAVALANDVESVALPMIRYSEVFDDDDLLAIVRSGCTAKQIAVARRKHVTKTVSGALVNTRRKDVVSALLANSGADIGEDAYTKVIDEFAGDPDVHAWLVDRAVLPPSVSARLINTLADELRERLIERHGIPKILADEIIMHGRDRAVSNTVASDTPREEVERLLAALRTSHGLSPTFLLRALSKGDLGFFETSLAAISRLPQENVSKLLRDRGARGFQYLYARSQLPPQLYAAFRTALDVVLEVRAERSIGWSDEDTKRIVRGLVQNYDDVCPEDIENVIGRLARRITSPKAAAPASANYGRWDNPPAAPAFKSAVV